MMNRLLIFLSVMLSVIALLSVIWIIVPAPSYYIWLYSVAVSEWSLWFGALALVGIVCALSARFGGRNGNIWLASFFIGGLAFIISLYPFFSVIAAARQENVSLSLKRYLSGLFTNGNSSEIQTKNFTTYTFARVGETELKLDVYLPPENTANNGAGVIVVHGGSWNGGTRNDFPQWNRRLVEQGYTVFDVDYRIAPQPNYLTATGDVKCAVRWVKEHAAEFKIAPERIALLGRSAGAHLALLAAFSAGDARLPAACQNAEKMEKSENVRAVVLLYAPIELLWAYDNPANLLVIDGPTTLSRFLGGSPHESAEIRERFVLASPAAHVSADSPPTLLVHGGQDQLVRVENMYFLADKLKQANVPHKTIYLPYAQHGFDYNFNGFGSQIAESVILDFLRENTQAE